MVAVLAAVAAVVPAVVAIQVVAAVAIRAAAVKITVFLAAAVVVTIMVAAGGVFPAGIVVATVFRVRKHKLRVQRPKRPHPLILNRLCPKQFQLSRKEGQQLGSRFPPMPL